MFLQIFQVVWISECISETLDTLVTLSQYQKISPGEKKKKKKKKKKKNPF